MAKKGRRNTAPRVAPKAPVRPAWRRRAGVFVALGLALVGLAVIVGLYWARNPAWRIERRLEQNVLLITIDTLRADVLGCYGGRAATPNLDRLASLGARFDFAHAHAVITLPSHASILTGLYPTQHGVHENSGYRLAADIPTLASRLKPHGFATGAFVGAFPVDSRFGLNAGFDMYDDHYPGTSMNSEFKLPERRADAVVQVAIRWIAVQQGRWFAWVHVFDPHSPYTPPPPFDRQYAGQPYLGEVAWTDSALGSLLETVAGLDARPTLVIVTGDHGESLGDHGEETHGLFAYESTLRVPLILAQFGSGTERWPPRTGSGGRAKAGTAMSTPVWHVDVLPTVLDALGIAAPPGLPGRSLLPGAASAADAGRASYFEALSASLNRGWAPLRGVLRGREKYIELPIPELYDLAADPGEQTSLADRQPDVRQALEARLRTFPAGAPGTRRREDPEAVARLRALGYVTGSAPQKSTYTEEDDPKRLVSIDQAIHRGVDVYQRKGPREAVPIYQEIIAKRPTMELAYMHLAMLQWELGEPQAAIATLRSAVRAGAKSDELRAKLGVYLAENGEAGEALPLLEQTAKEEFPDLDALNALGIALGRSGRTKEAIETFNRILRLNPSNAMALENLGAIALSQGRIDEARRAFSLALEADPASAEAHNGLGAVEVKSGNRRAAIEHWKVAVARDRENYDALYNLATELVADGRSAEARPYLERFAQTAPAAFYANDIRQVRDLLKRLER
jgi:arylsulfatase A-like enzyme/Flp pilus assembly protein TadD